VNTIKKYNSKYKQIILNNIGKLNMSINPISVGIIFYSNRDPIMLNIENENISNEGINSKYSKMIEQINNQSFDLIKISIKYICSSDYAIINNLDIVDYIFFISPDCDYGQYYILDNVLTYQYFNNSNSDNKPINSIITGKMSYHIYDSNKKTSHIHKYCDNLYVNFRDLNKNTLVFLHNPTILNLILHNKTDELCKVSCYSCDYFNFIQSKS
jgi:hypothetical protein